MNALHAEDKDIIKANIMEELSPFDNASDDKLRKAYKGFPLHVRKVPSPLVCEARPNSWNDQVCQQAPAKLDLDHSPT